MTDVDVKIKGLKKFLKRIEPEKQKKFLGQLIFQSSNEIRNDAWENADERIYSVSSNPNLTGALKRGIKIERPDKFSAIIYSDPRRAGSPAQSNYSMFQDLGTRRLQPTYFFEDARKDVNNNLDKVAVRLFKKIYK